MKTSDFYYELPEELIAQHPVEKRTDSRLMILDKTTGEIEHKHFRSIIEYLYKGDTLVLNDTRVLPARIFGTRKGKEEKIEFLLLKKMESNQWETLVKPGKKAKVGNIIEFGNGLLVGEIASIGEEGTRIIRFKYNGDRKSVV